MVDSASFGWQAILVGMYYTYIIAPHIPYLLILISLTILIVQPLEDFFCGGSDGWTVFCSVSF